MKLLNILNGTIIVEVSEKLKKQLITKFSDETQDDAKTIGQYIDDFERYKQSVDPKERDITRYSYKQLKSLIDPKIRKYDIETAFKKIKQKEGNIPHRDLRLLLKKFFEIQSELKGENKNLNNKSYLKLTKFLNDNYENLLTQKLIKKFGSEERDLNIGQIVPYIENYIRYYDEFSSDLTGADLKSFSEFENMIDAKIAEKGLQFSKEEDISDIDVVYEKDNLTIFAPKTKDQCIRLKNGRGWCTSASGASNYYYKYRLNDELTLYYVIDSDRDFEDRYYATVILVDRYGNTRFADKTNAGRFGGGTDLEWSEISGYIPKLTNLKNLFVPRPFSEDEIEMRNKYRRLNHDARYNHNAFGGKTVMEYFDSPREVELFLEINSGSLFDEDYSSLPDELKKKYIGMGYDLSSDMIKNSSPSVLKYYADKKIEDIKQKRLGDLTSEDIALLNAPMFASLKNELKKKYSEGLSVDGGTRFELRGSQDGKVGRFISLYGLDEVFEMLPTSTNVISLVGDGPKGTPFKLPKAITRLKNVYSLSIQNNAISELPDFICELEDLSHLGLVNNPNLTKLPECLADLENLTIMNISGSGITKLPKKLEEKMEEVGGGIYNVHGF